jgi:flagellar biosynthetic protein FliQ
MDSSSLVDLTRQAVVTGAVLLAPAVVTALVVGALLSLLQAVTQVQDQAITFVPKLVVVGVVLLVLMPWMTEYFVEYARDMITQIPTQVFGG